MYLFGVRVIFICYKRIALLRRYLSKCDSDMYFDFGQALLFLCMISRVLRNDIIGLAANIYHLDTVPFRNIRNYVVKGLNEFSQSQVTFSSSLRVVLSHAYYFLIKWNGYLFSDKSRATGMNDYWSEWSVVSVTSPCIAVICGLNGC